MNWKYKKALVQVKKHLNFVPLIFVLIIVIIGKINAGSQNYLILQLYGIDRLFNHLFFFILFGIPVVMCFYFFFHSRKNLLIKLYRLILKAPPLLICFLLGQQPVLGFKTSFIISSKAKFMT